MTERLPPQLRLSFPLFRYPEHRRMNVAVGFSSLLLPAESAQGNSSYPSPLPLSRHFSASASRLSSRPPPPPLQSCVIGKGDWKLSRLRVASEKTSVTETVIDIGVCG